MRILAHSKRKLLLPVAGICILILYILSRFFQEYPNDPTINGKKLSQWVKEDVEKPQFEDHSLEQLQIIRAGSNAVPFLIKAIQKKPGLVNTATYRSIHAKIPTWFARNFPTPTDIEQIHVQAYYALNLLGADARTAVPFLIEQFNPNNNLLSYTKGTLSILAPHARDAIPTLTNALHSSNPEYRYEAATTLAKIEPGYPELLPLTLNDLKSSNTVARRFACAILFEMPTTNNTAIQALEIALKDDDTVVRRNATEALTRIQQQITNTPTFTP